MNNDKLKNIIRFELENNKLARTDDFYLYNCVVSRLCGIGVLLIPFGTVLKMHKVYGLPNYESVTRIRRMIQSESPELKDEEIAEYREELQKEMREYVTNS